MLGGEKWLIQDDLMADQTFEAGALAPKATIAKIMPKKYIIIIIHIGLYVYWKSFFFVLKSTNGCGLKSQVPL